MKSLFLLSPSTTSPSSQSLIKITSAYCSSLSLSIPWTSITTSPIVIAFDCLEIVIDILDSPAATPTNDEGLNKVISDLTSSDEEKAYGFVDKIIDGISFSLNLLHVKLRAAHFTASMDLTFLKANSSPPNFKLFPGKKQDLRLTRIKSNPFVLLFKTVSWQTLKLEAKARAKDGSCDSDDENFTGKQQPSPSRRRRNNDVIRLISSGGSAQLTVKKSLLNREVVCVKSSFVLEDILWLLSATSSQFRDALTLIESISSIIVSQSTVSTSSSKKQDEKNGKPTSKSSPSKTATVKVDKNSSLYKIFAQFDPVESCVHINLKTFQLQIVDDMNIQEGSFHSKYPPLEMGSALLLSATGVNFSIYPEYCPRRGFKNNSGSEDDVSLQVFIRLAKLQLHAVGLNDTRMKSRKRNDGLDDKNKYLISAPASSNPMPDDVIAVEVSIHHYYDDMDGTLHDSVKIKVGPSRVYVDEPTLLWLHSFIIPIIASGQQMTEHSNVLPKAAPFVNVDVEVLFPVLVMDQKNPFAIFPSPFVKTTVAAEPAHVDLVSQQELEVKAARVLLQRLQTNDEEHNAWSIVADPVWAELLSATTDLRKPLGVDRLEILEPVSVKGTILMFPETPVSLEEIRVSVNLESEAKVNILPHVIPGLVSLLTKLDTFGDFMAQDKLGIKTCFPLMKDSQLNLEIVIPSLHAKLLRVKPTKDMSRSSSDQTTGSAESALSDPGTTSQNMRRSYSAPIDVGDESTVADLNEESKESYMVSHPLSVDRLLQEQAEGQPKSGSRTSLASDVTPKELLNPDLASLDSRVSDEEDFLILTHMQVPSSMSSSPSLVQIQGNHDSDVEEAEDVSALLGEDDRMTPFHKPHPELETVFAVKLTKLMINKRAVDLHSVTEISSRQPLTISEPLTEPTTRVPSPTEETTQIPSDKSENSLLLIRSEIAWSHSEGKSELTSILMEKHPVISIHSTTLEVIGSSFQSLQVPNEVSSSESPPVDVFVKDVCLVVLESSVDATVVSGPKVTLKLPAAIVNKSQDNVISVLPVNSTATSLRTCLEEKHRQVFGTDVVSSFVCEPVSSKNSRDAVLTNQDDEEVLKQVLCRNEALESELKKLKEENELLKKWVEKSSTNNTIPRN